MKYRCPSCNHDILDISIEHAVFLGKPMEYWIELQAKVEELDAVTLMDEITKLKAELYTYQNAVKLLNERIE
jgi:hypothetical protein